MVYENCKIYGPYQGKDKRLRLIIVYPDRSKHTVSYPKYLMEIHLDRYLSANETVDHIDCNFLNNELSNLRILDRSLHSSIDVKRYKPESFKCPICNIDFSLDGKRLHKAIYNRLANKAGPFCGRKCAGKYSKLKIKLAVKPIIPSHITIKSQQEP